jgi:hypothetical protein
MRTRSRLPLGILTIAISAAAFYLSTGLGAWWPLAWVAPLPVLITSSKRSWPAAASIAFAAFFLGSFNTPYGLPGWVLFGFPQSVAFAVATLAFRVVARRRLVRVDECIGSMRLHDWDHRNKRESLESAGWHRAGARGALTRRTEFAT